MKRVFLSYSRKDFAKAKRLYKELNQLNGLKVWFDKEALLPGMKWKPAIRKAIRETDFFIAMLSKETVSKKGYRHKELREAMKIRDEFPEDQVFLIPARINECEMPVEDLRDLTYADLFPDWKEGVEILKKALGFKKAAKEKVKRKSTGKRSLFTYQYRIGLADLDIGLTNLDNLAEELNKVQSFFHFTLSQLRTPLEAVGDFDGSKNLKTYRLTKSFYRDWEHLNVDRVICMTKHFLSFEKGDTILYNYISGPSRYDERFIFLSVGGLYGYAKQAGIRYEMALVFLIVSRLACYFFTAVGFHKQLRGCPMDFTKDHETVVPGLQKGSFCPQCTKVLSQNTSIHEALTSLLEWGRNP